MSRARVRKSNTWCNFQSVTFAGLALLVIRQFWVYGPLHNKNSQSGSSSSAVEGALLHPKSPSFLEEKSDREKSSDRKAPANSAPATPKTQPKVKVVTTTTTAPKAWRALKGLAADEGAGVGDTSDDLEACQASCDANFACTSITYAPGWCHLKDLCVTDADSVALSDDGKSTHKGGDHVTLYKPCSEAGKTIRRLVSDGDGGFMLLGDKPTRAPPSLLGGAPKEKQNYKIFTYWDYKGGADPFVALNIDTWLAHAPPGTELIRVNDSNIQELVPDTPQEYFRLPYAAAKSDFVRASVLYHQGGLYMDADFLVLGDLGEIFKLLDDGYDIVAYSDDQGKSGDCRKVGGFSSNFLAGRKGNAFHKTWWENVKRKLTRICGEGEFLREKVCCHEAFAPKPEKRVCHIPWAHLEWLKLPRFDADAKKDAGGIDPTQKQRATAPVDELLKNSAEGQDIMKQVEEGNTKAFQLPDTVQMYCFRGREGFTPHINGEIYWQPWDMEKKRTDFERQKNPPEGIRYDDRFDCQEDDKGDIDCKKGNWGKSQRAFPNFFGRISYHLFFSTHRPHLKTREEVFKHSWLVSELYLRALPNLNKDGSSKKPLAAIAAPEAKAPSPAPATIEAKLKPKKKVPRKIFTFWDYPRGPDPFTALNIKSWVKHAGPGTEIIFVNDTNIRRLVPDIVPEWSRLPYAAAKSDFVRSSVLYHNGGIYMDADFMVNKPLEEVFEKLDAGWDVVAYIDPDGPKGPSGECPNSAAFTSNFIAARPKNGFSEAWWSNVKLKMTRLCDRGAFSMELVCCHEAYTSGTEKRPCHIPWAHLEWLKNPAQDADLKEIKADPTQKRSPRAKVTPGVDVSASEEADIRKRVADGQRPVMQIPPETKMYCYKDKDGMAAHLNGEVYWQPWDKENRRTDLKWPASKDYDMRFDCAEVDGDLDCRKGNWGNDRRVIKNFFNRVSYHLFFSTKKPSVRSVDDVLNGHWLISDMYQRTLSSSPAPAPSRDASDAEDFDFSP